MVSLRLSHVVVHRWEWPLCLSSTHAALLQHFRLAALTFSFRSTPLSGFGLTASDTDELRLHLPSVHSSHNPSPPSLFF
jgi:hypothetical protein